MTEVLGESVKSAMGRELMKYFPEVENWYRETPLTELRYPHFFIIQANLSSREERKNYYFLRYLMMLRYRQVPDPNTNPVHNRDLDAIGFRLIRDITQISIGARPIRVTDVTYQKVDGVLHMTCAITLNSKKITPQPEVAKMEELDIMVHNLLQEERTK